MDMTDTTIHQDALLELPTEQGILRYRDIGEGTPLILLHGSGPGVTGWLNYRDVVGELAERFRCLILEFPGFGVSDPGPGHPMTMAQSAVGHLMDGLGIDKADVIGNSLGGAVALNIAINEPSRLDRIVTIGGIGRNILGSFPSEGIKLLAEFTDNPTRESLVRWLHSMVSDPATITDELIEERWSLATGAETLEIARRMYSSAALAAMMEANKSSTTPPYWTQLGRISSPVLATWGRDDRVSPVEMALLPMADIPNCEVHVFPRCGHWTMLEARDAWQSSVIEFLSRGRQFD